MHIEFRQLRQFLAVVESQSFTAAAEKLHMTQPALTRSVQQLEERFNVRLIDRAAKTFELTPFGRILAERARLIEQELAHIDSEIVALKSGETGRIRIGTGPSGIGYLPAAIIDFQRERPNVDIVLTVDSMDANVAALLNRDLDLICTALEFPPHPTLVCERILEVGNVVVASRQHPLADLANIEARNLLRYPWVGFVNDDMARSRLGGYFSANAREMPRIAVQTNNLETLFALLARSDYVASIPALVLPDAKARDLVALKVKGSFWSIGLGFAHVRTSQLPPALKIFLSILRARILTIKNDQPSLLDA